MAAFDANSNIRHARFTDIDALGALLSVAFTIDPFVRWILPQASDYEKANYAYARINAASSIPYNACHIIGDCQGMALWRPPGICPDFDAITREVDIYTANVVRDEFARLREACAQFEPTEPHWHLSLIAIDPFYMGMNLGSQLLRYGLQRCDQQGSAVYLESTNHRNLTFYQRHGFRLLSEVSLPGMPRRYPMLRPAQT